MNKKDVSDLSVRHRAMALAQIERDRELNAIRTKFYAELRDIRERLEERILMTPTGPTRNLLTDCNIVISHIVDGKLLALPQ